VAAGLDALYGLEVRTEEEVDVLCLFDELEAALAWQDAIYPALPAVANDPLLFGDQVVVDQHEKILRMEPKLLINAVAIPLQIIVEETVRRGGLAIPAHIDRPVNSLISQLGFPPPGCPFDAAEISRFGNEEEIRALHPGLRDLPLVRFSDAHLLDDLGKQRTVFRVSDPSVGELRKALRGEEGRFFQAAEV
jgi:PHP family Zn ribbon phosphoesterase